MNTFRYNNSKNIHRCKITKQLAEHFSQYFFFFYKKTSMNHKIYQQLIQKI